MRQHSVRRPAVLSISAPGALVCACPSCSSSRSSSRTNPGQLLCGNSGHGSGQHFVCELLARSAGIKLQNVPYKGTGPMLLGTASGKVHISIGLFETVRVTALEGLVERLDRSHVGRCIASRNKRRSPARMFGGVIPAGEDDRNLRSERNVKFNFVLVLQATRTTRDRHAHAPLARARCGSACHPYRFEVRFAPFVGRRVRRSRDWLAGTR